MTTASNRLDTLAGHVLLLVAVVAVTALGYSRADARVKDVAVETHNTLCAFKRDLVTRHKEGKVIVDAIREGKRPPISGITISELDRSIANQERTLLALAELDCG